MVKGTRSMAEGIHLLGILGGQSALLVSAYLLPPAQVIPLPKLGCWGEMFCHPSGDEKWA